MHVSRPTVDRWIARFEAEHFEGLLDHQRGPKSPRKGWFPVMVEVYHLQQRHPAAGAFRLWSLLARPDLSVRTIGRIMALHKKVYDDISPVRPKGTPQEPAPHPSKATILHAYWCIAGRKMDLTIAGVQWWSLLILEGYSRTMLAGAVAPSEASWVAFMVLYTAWLRYGVPTYLISDRGGALTSDAFEAVCPRLGSAHQPMESTKGASCLHWRETHVNGQWRLYDSQFSLTQTPVACEQAHQAFLEL